MNDPTSLVEQQRRTEAALRAAESAKRRLELLAAAGAELSRSLEPSTTLQAIASTLVPAVVDWCRVDLVDGKGELQRALTHHSDPEKARYGTELAARLHASPGAIGSMAWAVSTGKTHLAHFSPPRNFDQVRDRDLLTFADAIGMRAYFLVPLIARGRTLGAMAAIQAESGRELGPEDCSLISELAQRAALALDNARLYAQAESALLQARTANRAKDEFLAMLGHELRNPLAPIVNSLQLMKLRDPGGHLEERKIIERQVTHLSRLVDDLLDVSRITKGKVQLKRERVDLSTVIAWALEQAKPVLDERAHPVTLENTGAKIYVDGDSVRLAQVFCNLLTNAAKFTPPEGRISISLRASGGVAEVAVKDSGKGLGPDLLPRVFELFVQGEQGAGSHSGGLGLGLAIVKNLAEMHGGSVEALSEGQGRGATFIVRLPLVDGTVTVADTTQPLSGAPAQARPSKSPETARILLVDDNHDAAFTLAELLGDSGYETRIASDGKSALATIREFAADLAILDIGLPDIDGYSLAAKLTAEARKPIKLIALTGYGGEADRSRALAASFSEHLVKPVAFAQLLGVVRTLLGSAPRKN